MQVASSLAEGCNRQLLFFHEIANPDKVKVGGDKDNSAFHQVSTVTRQHLRNSDDVIVSHSQQ